MATELTRFLRGCIEDKISYYEKRKESLLLQLARLQNSCPHSEKEQVECGVVQTDNEGGPHEHVTRCIDCHKILKNGGVNE